MSVSLRLDEAPQRVAETEVLLVLYHSSADWCRYCAQVRPIVEQAARTLHREGRPGSVAMVDLHPLPQEKTMAAINAPVPTLRLFVNGTKRQDMEWNSLTKFNMDDVPEPIANLVRSAYGDPTRLKCTNEDSWDRKYHTAITKNEAPVWVADGVSVELASFLSSLRSGGRWDALTTAFGGSDLHAMELGCGLGEDSLAISRLGFASTRGVDISESAVAQARKLHSGVDGLSFDALDVYKLQTPEHAPAFIYDNTVYQNARPYGKTEEYLALLTRLTANSVGALVLINVRANRIHTSDIDISMSVSLVCASDLISSLMR